MLVISEEARFLDYNLHPTLWECCRFPIPAETVPLLSGEAWDWGLPQIAQNYIISESYEKRGNYITIHAH